MTVVITFPAKGTTALALTPREVADEVLHELLRKAVVAHRAGEARAQGSLGHRHHLAVSLALLDAIQIVMGVSDVAQELGRCMEAGITDIRQLTRIARDFDGPQSA
ncbi:hypothetical protein [Paenarthrobacter sp. YJN-5]|uniref:hypothetical protein n=1 Tax=Paenarthrobacter sp. YJN-5 TaxID=2735316 RepID=UPI001877EFA4|nr:hypothetical protein [Paenarthrobacter sp. YJN-5]QOT19598.1 hypothetical protein HMI59_23540 [Paenarthrobacter sp. YJN-5]